MPSQVLQNVWDDNDWYPKGAGVYAIICTKNNRIYIGSSVHMDERLSRHFTMLRGCKHENPILQNHYNKYGENSLFCVMLERTKESERLAREQFWIDKYTSSGRLMNIQHVASRPPSFNELPPKTQERVRAKLKKHTGRKPSARLLAVLHARVGANNPNFGKKLPQDRVKRMSERMRGELNPSYGKRGELSANYGVRKSAETIQNMRLAQKRRSEIYRHNGISIGRKCVCVSKDGCVKEYSSLVVAARALGVNPKTVSGWCRSLHAPSNGSVWRYA